MRTLRALTFGLVCVACNPTLKLPGEARTPPTAPGGASAVRVGTARADITPPPGPATFGHGPDSLAAQGYWTRLYCRAFVFERVDGARYAIVPCDLAAVSLLLQREVAARVSDVVPTTRLMLSATHTHHGPAHYFENVGYSEVMSTRRPGLDSNMVNFLAGRIATAVKEAAAHPVLARIRWTRRPVWGLARNRSREPFYANVDRFHSRFPPPTGLPEALRRVDPELDVLQIEEARRPGVPIATMAFFAMHPTVLPAHSRLFDGDTHAVASRLVERELGHEARARGARREPLVAIVNTNQGDVSPAWIEGTAHEAVRLGTRLAQEIWDASRENTHQGWSTEVALDNRYVEVDLPHAAFSGGHLCPAAILGQASGKGGSDHRSTVEGLIDEPPDTVETQPASANLECHRPKRELLGLIQPLLVSTEGFPEHVPLALQRLGDEWLAFVPAELTITAGYRLRRTLERRVRPAFGRGDALVVGLANAYIYYVTTAEEYQLQHYEGGATLYGPKSADYLTEMFDWLALSATGQPARADLALGEAKAVEYRRATERARFPDAAAGKSLAELGSRRGPHFVCRVPAADPPAICVQWADGAPGRVLLTHAPWVRLVHADREEHGVAPCWRPLGASDGVVCDDALTVDDRGFEFFTRALERAGDVWIWSTLYRPSWEQWRELAHAGALRVRVGDLASPEFTVTRLETCLGERLRRCVTGIP